MKSRSKTLSFLPWLLIMGGFYFLSILPWIVALGSIQIGITMLILRIWPEQWSSDGSLDIE
jgi:hypothetical protein